MLNKTHISFIVPAYNCVHTIGQTIESIFDNNFEFGDEVIIVNDFSTDNTLETINNYKEKYPILQIINHKVNKGTAAASRNTGIEQANNDLIFCLDSDNILATNSIPKLKAHLIEQNADAAAFGELHYFNETIDKITHKWIYLDQITLADALCGRYWPGPSGNYLFTRLSWLKAGRYYEPTLDNQTLDSWTFGIRQLGTGSKLVSLPGTWYYHRYGHQSHYLQNYEKGNSSIAALIGIAPFLHMLEDKDIDYIFSNKARFNWYTNLEMRPIRVKNCSPGKKGKVVYISQHIDSHPQKRSFLMHIKNILKNFNTRFLFLEL